MDRAALLAIYGTDEPLPAVERLQAGRLAIEIADGAARSVSWDGIEVLRGIDYPIRDADWGTCQQVTLAERHEADGAGFRYERTFTAADGGVKGRLFLHGRDSSLELSLTLTATRPIMVNRAGFVVLHPVAGVAGSPLEISHSDGTVEATRFPEMISPGQPVFGIAGLVQTANGVRAEIEFDGDVFEMEDQRNWSDASYKTYCRPLALPTPYALDAGEPVRQTIRVAFSHAGPRPAASKSDAIVVGTTTGRMPEVTLSLEAGWEAEDPAIDALGVPATRIRVDTTDGGWLAVMDGLLAASRGALDLEIVVSDEADAMDAALAALADELARRGQSPRMAMALPKAYLKSYQPDGHWPTGVSPAEATAAVRRHFPHSLVMSGMLTNFTELNRHREAAADGDVVTHGTTAIVHAADDLSVMQALEALPQIFSSAMSIAAGKPYHLGLVTIGMRSNPYGAGLAPNPDNIRRPMAMADPRQRGLFGAAWMVGAMAATAGSGVSGLSLGAPAGPLGILGEGGVRPAYHVFRQFTRQIGGERLAVNAPPDLATVAVRNESRVAFTIANLRSEPRSIPLAGECLVLPAHAVHHDWLASTPPTKIDRLELGPYGVGFAWLDNGKGGVT